MVKSIDIEAVFTKMEMCIVRNIHNSPFAFKAIALSIFSFGQKTSEATLCVVVFL